MRCLIYDFHFTVTTMRYTIKVMAFPIDNDELQKLLAERADLQKKLLIYIKQCSENKKELVNSAEREEELNHKIGKLLGLIKRLKDELDMYKSSSQPEPVNDGNLDSSQTGLPVTSHLGGEVSEADVHSDSAKPTKFRKTNFPR